MGAPAAAQEGSRAEMKMPGAHIALQVWCAGERARASSRRGAIVAVLRGAEPRTHQLVLGAFGQGGSGKGSGAGGEMGGEEEGGGKAGAKRPSKRHARTCHSPARSHTGEGGGQRGGGRGGRGGCVPFEKIQVVVAVPPGQRRR